MATPTLPSTGSIINYLDSKKQDSSYGARKKLYTDLGMDSRLGSFTGTPNQNMSLLRSLQQSDTTKGAVSAPQDTTPRPGISSPSALGITQGAPPAAPGGISTLSGALTTLFQGLSPAATPTTKPSAVGVMDTAGKAVQEAASANANAVAAAGGGAYKPNDASGSGGMSIYNPAAPPPPAATDSSGANVEMTTSKTNDETTKSSTGGTSASTIFPEIFKESTAGEADVVNDWLNSPEGQNFISDTSRKGLDAQAIHDEAIAKLEATYAGDKTKLEENLAKNGLAFSGIRSSQVKALADALASSELGVHRQFASKLLDADADLRDAILQGVADLAKKAADDDKAAIDQLNKAGFAVINGELMPTLAAETARRQQENSDRSYELSVAKENRIRATGGSSGNKLTWSEANSHGLPTSLVGQTEQDVIDSLYSPEPPPWFRQKAEGEAKASLTPGALQQLWNTASEEYLSGDKESASHAKAASYAKTSFDGMVADDVEVFANLVDNYINGGMSYADAVDQAVTDFTEE